MTSERVDDRERLERKIISNKLVFGASYADHILQQNIQITWVRTNQ